MATSRVDPNKLNVGDPLYVVTTRLFDDDDQEPQAYTITTINTTSVYARNNAHPENRPVRFPKDTMIAKSGSMIGDKIAYGELLTYYGEKQDKEELERMRREMKILIDQASLSALHNVSDVLFDDTKEEGE